MRFDTLQHKLADIINADRRGSSISRIYDWCMEGVIVVSLIPLMLLDDSNLWISIISWTTVIIFLLDFIARCLVSPIDTYKIGRPWWRRYPFSFMGLVDFLSILPIFGMVNHRIALFKLFRLVKIASILKFSRYSDKDDLLLRVIKKNYRILRSIFIFVLLYVFISALLIFNVEPHDIPTSDEAPFSTFFNAVYWSFVTLTTVGYGDIYPVTILGKIISICSMVFGIGIIATVSSVVTAGIIEEVNKQNK